MYTELPHDELKMAVDWIILRFTTRFAKNTTLNVRKCLRKGPSEKQMNVRVVLGSSCVSKRRHYAILMLQLRALIHFEIGNVFFKVGPKIYKQIKGIPMGSSPSPALAYLIIMHIL